MPKAQPRKVTDRADTLAPWQTAICEMGSDGCQGEATEQAKANNGNSSVTVVHCANKKCAADAEIMAKKVARIKEERRIQKQSVVSA